MGNGARSRGRVGHDDQCGIKEEIVQLQKVFDDNLVIPEECFARNRQKFFLIGKLLGHRFFNPEFMVRSLCRR